jgi:hypothetical protein
MAVQGRLPWLVVGGVVVAIAAATWFIRSDDAAAPAVAAPGPVADDGRGSPVQRGAQPASTASRPPRDPIERMAEISDRRAQSREDYLKRTEALRQTAEKSFAAEKVDAAWAPAKETALDAVAAQPSFATANAAPRRMQVECRSSMCRIDSEFGSMGQAEDWLLLYMSSVGSTLPNSVVTRTPNPDGSASIRIYGRGR